MGKRVIGAALAAVVAAGLAVTGLAEPAAADTSLVDYSCDIPPVNALIQSQVPDPAPVDDLEVTMVDTPDPVVQGRPVHFDIDYPVLDLSEGLPPAPSEIGTYGTVRLKFFELTATIPAGLSSVTASFESPCRGPPSPCSGARSRCGSRARSAAATLLEPDLTPPTIKIEDSPGHFVDLDHIPSVNIDGIASGAAGTSIDWKPPSLLTQVKYKKTVTVVIFPVDVVNWNDENLPCVPVDPNQVVVSTAIVAPAPGLSVTTTAAEDAVEAGQAVHYTVTTTNTGNVALTAVAVTAAPTGCTAAGPIALAVGSSTTTTCTLTTTLADVGTLSRTATADSAETAPATSPTESVTVSGPPSPLVTLTPTEGAVDVGEVIHYALTVKNRAAVLALTGLDLSGSGLTCDALPGSIAAGATASLACTHTAGPTDVGSYTSSVTIGSTEAPDGSVTSSATTVMALVPGLSVTTTATEDTVEAGEAIHWSVEVENTGEVALTGVVVTDAPSGCTGTPGSLAIGASTTLTCAVTTGLNDVGTVTEAATADSAETSPVTSADDTVAVTAIPDPTVTLTPTETAVAPGDTIHYTLTVANGAAALDLSGLAVSSDDVDCASPPSSVGAGDDADIACTHVARNWELGPYAASAEVDTDQAGPVQDAAADVTVAIPPHGFGDIAPSAYYDDGVDYAKFFGLVNGFPGNTFRPNDPVNRGQIVNMLWQLMGQPAGSPAHGFADVPANAFYRSGLDWAKAEGLVRGFPRNRYLPADPVNRCQLANMVWNLVGAPTGSPASGYTDVNSRLYCRSAVAWARAQGLVTAFAGGTRFRPMQAAKRGEVAYVLHRLALTESAWSAADDIPDPVLFDPTD